jgi:prephenate dehydrogenase
LERLGTVAIVGVGLIGGSIGLALRARGLVREVVGIGRDPGKLETAKANGAIDRATSDFPQGVAGAEVVVVCTPVSQVAHDVRRAAEIVPASTLLTDAGSTKKLIVETVQRHPQAAALFIGAHPLAGSERTGVVNARADLFEDRVCVITPTPFAPKERIERARQFWRGLGCRVIAMSPIDHDEVVAYTSHLPHALSAALAGSVPAEWLPLAAGAFRDGTRVAGSDTMLWTAIFRDNRGPLLKALGTFQDRLSAFKYAVMTDDEEAIRRWWEDARQRRQLFESSPAAGNPDS